MDIVEFLTQDGVTAIANGFSITTLVYLLIERWRKRYSITVILQADGGDYIELPGKIQRGEFTRAELQGRLGMLPMKDPKQHRYKLPYTNQPEYIDQVYKVANGWRGRVFTIECTNRELDQFNVTKKKR